MSSNIESAVVGMNAPICAATDAFQNPVILKKIFSYASGCNKTVAKYRLVCKTWTTVSFSQWRSSATLTLLQNQMSAKENVYEEKISIQDFADFYSSDDFELRSSPFRKYKLKMWNLDEMNNVIMEQIFEGNLGQVVTHLHVDQCSGSGSHTFKFFNDFVFKQFPKLEVPSLTENSIPSFGIRERDFHRSSITLPNLHTLKLEGLSPRGFSVHHRLFPKLETLKLKTNTLSCNFPPSVLPLEPQQSGLKTIEILPWRHYDSIGNCIPTRLLDISAMDGRRYCHLEYLSMDLLFGLQAIELSELLKAYSATLKVVKLWGRPEYVNMTQVPSSSLLHHYFQSEMPSLEELYVYGDTKLIISFNFLAFLPNLKKLQITTSGQELWEQLEYTMPYLYETVVFAHYKYVTGPVIFSQDDGLTLHFLKYLHVDTKFDAGIIERLAKLVPNLTTLHTVADLNVLDAICKMWPNLEELHMLYGSDIDDEGISQIKKLRCLQRFRLDVHCNGGRLTDWSVYNVFFRIRSNLNTLWICVSPLLSVDMENYLSNRILNTTVVWRETARRLLSAANFEKHN